MTALLACALFALLVAGWGHERRLYRRVHAVTRGGVHVKAPAWFVPPGAWHKELPLERDQA